MELTLLIIAWVQAFFFTYLAYTAKDNRVFPIIAGITWLIVSVGAISITYIGWDSMGNPTLLTRIGNASSLAAVGQILLSIVAGLMSFIMLFLGAGWIMTSRKTGDEV
jgi:hypothetical protein